MKEGKLEPRDYAFESDDRTNFEMLKDQFDSPEKAMREGVQNSLAAQASQISVSSNYSEGIFELNFEDNGRGMTPRERDEKFLRMGNYGKEGNPQLPGEYGMGIHSFWAYEPEQILVESKPNGEDPWRAVIDGKGEGTIKEPIDPELNELEPQESYTKITMKKRTDSEAEARKLEKNAKSSLKEYCRKVKIPIFFHGENISQEPFDLPSPRIRYQDGKGREIVIGKSKPKNLEVYSHRIKIATLSFKKGLPLGYRILLNDPYLKPVVSRNDVKEDENFKKALEIVKEEIGKFDQKIFEQLENYFLKNFEENPREIESRIGECYRYGTGFINGKIEEARSQESWFRRSKRPEDLISEEILRSRLFKTTQDKELTLKDLLEQGREKPFYVADKPSRITKRFEFLRDVILFDHPSGQEFLNQINSQGGFRSVNVNKKYYTPPLDSSGKNRENRDFQTLLEDLEQQFDNTRIVLGEFDPEEGLGKEKEIYVTDYNWKYLDEPPINEDNYETLVILNHSSSPIRKLEELSEKDRELGEKQTGWKIWAALLKAERVNENYTLMGKIRG